MPPVSDKFLLERLRDLGVFVPQSGHWEAITPTHLMHWMALTGYSLGPFQCETILRASNAFVSCYYSQSKVAPWRGHSNKRALSANIKKAFKAIAGK